MKRLVISADDFGMHAKVDDGIIEAHKKSAISHASWVAVGPAATRAAELALERKLSTGLHLCISCHLDCAAEPRDVRYLAPGGRFRKDWKELVPALLSGIIPEQELEVEFRAQYERAKSSGLTVTHLSSFEHFHMLPNVCRLVEQLGTEWNISVRWPTEQPNRTWQESPRAALKSMILTTLAKARKEVRSKHLNAIGIYAPKKPAVQKLLEAIASITDGDFELVTRPGFEPGVLTEYAEWRKNWQEEFDALTSGVFREALESRSIQMVTPSEIFPSGD